MQDSGAVGNGTNSRGQINLSAIGEAISLFQINAGTWIVAALIMVIVQLLVTAINNIATRAGGGGAILIILVAMVISVVINSILYAGLFGMALKQIKGQPIAFSDLFDFVDLAWPTFWASFMIGILTTLGFILCFFPGLIIAALSLLTLPLIVDRKMSASTAISTSWSTLKEQWLSAAVFTLIVGCIYMLGAMMCFIGLIVTLPIAILAITILYRDFFLGSVPPASSGEKFEPAIPPGS